MIGCLRLASLARQQALPQSHSLADPSRDTAEYVGELQIRRRGRDQLPFGGSAYYVQNIHAYMYIYTHAGECCPKRAPWRVEQYAFSVCIIMYLCIYT